jgi:hypothetical protein
MKVRGARRRAASDIWSMALAADAAIKAFQASTMSFVEAARALQSFGTTHGRGQAVDLSRLSRGRS